LIDTTSLVRKAMATPLIKTFGAYCTTGHNSPETSGTDHDFSELSILFDENHARQIFEVGITRQ